MSGTVIVTQELRLKRPVLAGLPALMLILFAALTGAGTAAWLNKLVPNGVVSPAVVLGLGAIVGAALVIPFWRRLTRVHPQPPVVVTTSDVTFPVRGGPVPLTDITSIRRAHSGWSRERRAPRSR